MAFGTTDTAADVSIMAVRVTTEAAVGIAWLGTADPVTVAVIAVSESSAPGGIFEGHCTIEVTITVAVDVGAVTSVIEDVHLNIDDAVNVVAGRSDGVIVSGSNSVGMTDTAIKVTAEVGSTTTDMGSMTRRLIVAVVDIMATCTAEGWGICPLEALVSTITGN